jgi:amino-acid N-acetyltransferase
VNPNGVLRGIGKSLVNQIIDETIRLGIQRLIALTYQDIFFQKCGFEVISKDTLHPKIIKDCMSCSKLNSCDEIAMQINVLSREN